MKDVPCLSMSEFRRAVISGVSEGARISSFFGCPSCEGRVKLFAALAGDEEGKLYLLSTEEAGDSYPSITPECPQAQLFEREIAEQWGVVPEGHPWFKPVRFHHSYREGHDAWARKGSDEIKPGVTDFFRVEGREVHEVAVGPVHAGVIEPGHFRFQCHGENVLDLEIALGYQHRGAERALEGGPNKRTMHYMETIAGDTSIGHATAYCQAIEALGHCGVSARAQALRGVMLELERLANHTGDLGAISNDIAFLPTASYCGRLRGDFLNMTALVCGNRFGRNMLTPGGVLEDVTGDIVKKLLVQMESVYGDLCSAMRLFWETSSVVDRLEGTGAISGAVCRELGLVGPAARACGVTRDVRSDFSYGIYRFAQTPVFTCEGGDVFARAYVRWMEAQKSADFVKEQLEGLPEGSVRAQLASLSPDSIAVSLTEGWRGEICHVAITDAAGKIARYKVTDPSFHNWIGLAMALRGQEISDFPLCNKSFNLSYCGHDL